VVTARPNACFAACAYALPDTPGPPGLTTIDPSRLPDAGSRSNATRMVRPAGWDQSSGTVIDAHSWSPQSDQESFWS
jgi:hypothetical protein